MNAPGNVSKLLLRHVPLLAMLPDDQLEALTTVVKRMNYSRGATIIAAGDATDSLYMVISGRLKVFMSDIDGHEVTLSILGPEEYFGEMVPIDESPRSASVVALEACEILMLSKHDFKKCLSRNFDMTMTVLRCLVQRLREADRKIGSLALMDVYGRVVRELMDMSEFIDGQRVITRKIVKKDIATMIGASREMVSRVMKDLQHRGLVEVRGNVMLLRDNIRPAH